ncbi:C-type mannose receptor 2-like [Pholidichthys leucotaenia]
MICGSTPTCGRQLARRAGLSTAWIGGYYFQGFWRWEDGSPFNYNNWYSPTSYSNDACTFLNSQVSRGWTNTDCTDEHPVMCSYKLSC